ncbi:hypothetical protein [Paracoccus sp. (in: a-proteobacteria)]|uniref:hypothetical protein n=1 Tax=Paracoccus sp. TaxID=267 RepID=UPI0035B0A5FA
MVDLLTVQALPEDGDWPATIPQLENGWYPTGGPVDAANDAGLLNWPNRELARRTRILRDRVDALMVKAGSLTTVGPGGDFGNLTDALAYLSERRPAYAPGGFVTEVRLLTGYLMAEQVLVAGANLGWLTITSEAAEVIISRGALATQMGSSFPAFGVSDGGVLPRIAALFVMDGTGVATDRVGVYARGTGSASVAPGAGVKNAGAHGMRAETGGQIAANGGVFSGAAEYCLYGAGGTRIAASLADLTNAGVAGIFATNGAVVHADQAVATGANTYGVRAIRGATVNAYGVNARRNGAGGADSTADFSIDSGGTIIATAGTGGVSTAVNAVSAAGVIYR